MSWFRHWQHEPVRMYVCSVRGTSLSLHIASGNRKGYVTVRPGFRKGKLPRRARARSHNRRSRPFYIR